jgi:Uncharacterized conserved protein
MKAIKLLFSTLFLLAFSFTNAQVSESERSMAGGVYPALSIVIPDTDDKNVAKWWKDFMKENKTKAKKVKKSSEVMSEGFRDVDINGTGDITLYARTDESGSDAEQIVWFDLGDNYLSAADGAKYQAAEKFMMRFGLYVTKRKTQLELKAEEKELKGFEGDLVKLGKDNKTYHKKIEDAKKLIAEMEENIVQNLKDQEVKQKEIEVQKEVVKEVKKRLEDLKM